MQLRQEICPTASLVQHKPQHIASLLSCHSSHLLSHAFRFITEKLHFSCEWYIIIFPSLCLVKGLFIQFIMQIGLKLWGCLSNWHIEGNYRLRLMHLLSQGEN